MRRPERPRFPGGFLGSSEFDMAYASEPSKVERHRLQASARSDEPARPHEVPAAAERAAAALEQKRTRLAETAAGSFQFLWRSLRRLGVSPDSAVDDAVQRVFEIAARKAEQVALGHERAFLFKTAILVAAEARRGQRRARERESEASIFELVSCDPNPEQALSERRSRECLDAVLETLPLDLRSVFVLYELEGLTVVEIAGLLEVPQGTAASRLRRAREQFQLAVRRLRAKMSLRGSP